MDRDELRTKFEKAFSELLLSYKIDAQPSISKDKSKYFEELILVNKVLQTLTVKDRKLKPFGCWQWSKWYNTV